MFFTKKYEISKATQDELYRIIQKMRFRFTALAHSCPEVHVEEKNEFGKVVTSVPVGIFNALFMYEACEDLTVEYWNELLKDFRQKNVPAMVAIKSDFPKESLQALEHAGAILKVKEYNLAVDLERFKVPWFIPRTITLRNAVSEIDMKIWRDLFFTSFRLPEAGRDYFLELMKGRNTFPGTDVQFLIAFKKDQPVGTIAIFKEGDVAAGSCTSILPEYRSLGVGTMMLASVVRELQKTKCRYMVGNSNEGGYRIYRKAKNLIHLGETLLYFKD